jgi:hypothetical protein
VLPEQFSYVTVSSYFAAKSAVFYNLLIAEEGGFGLEELLKL